MNKHILYIGGFELPDKNAAAQRVLSNAKIFRKLGYEVLLRGITKSGDCTGMVDGFLYNSVCYPKGIFDWFSYLTEINCKEIISQWQPSIIIAYNYPAIALEVLRKYCIKRNIQIIGDVTEWYSSGSNLFKWADTSYRMQIVNKRLDGLIVISRFLNNYYRDCKTIQLPPLVDLNDEKWLHKEMTIKDEKISLVYVGSPGAGSKDRLDLIVDFCINSNFSKKISLTVVGIKEEQYCAAFGKEKIDNNSVVFLGKIAHVEAIDILKSSDFQIFIRDNSRVNNAGFPTKFVESISCGIPVITNLTSNLQDYLVEGRNGFVVDLSSFELFEKSLMKILSCDRSKIEEMKQFCRNKQLFDYGRFIPQMKLFIDDIIEQ